MAIAVHGWKVIEKIWPWQTFFKLLLIFSLTLTTNVLSQSSKNNINLSDFPEPCSCSNESLVTMSKGLQQKLEDVSGRSFKTGEKFLNSIYGSMFNCHCGKLQCVITSTTRGINSISCVKKGLFWPLNKIKLIPCIYYILFQ